MVRRATPPLHHDSRGRVGPVTTYSDALRSPPGAPDAATAPHAQLVSPFARTNRFLGKRVGVVPCRRGTAPWYRGHFPQRHVRAHQGGAGGCDRIADGVRQEREHALPNRSFELSHEKERADGFVGCPSRDLGVELQRRSSAAPNPPLRARRTGDSQNFARYASRSTWTLCDLAVRGADRAW